MSARVSTVLVLVGIVLFTAVLIWLAAWTRDNAPCSTFTISTLPASRWQECIGQQPPAGWLP